MKKIRLLLLLILVSSLFIIVACGNKSTTEEMVEEVLDKSHAREDEKSPIRTVTLGSGENVKSGENLLSLQTKNTTRLNTNDPIEMSIMASQTIWPATHLANQPGGVILVPVEDWQIGLASVNLVHHPINGPVLFMEDDQISDWVLQEIDRLQPTGIKDGTQIFVMGKLDDLELVKLQDYKVKEQVVESHADFAYEIDEYYASLSGEYSTSVLIGSLEEKGELFSLIAANWIAHMEEPILYVSSEEIPDATKEALTKRNGELTMYLFGPESVISEKLADDLKEFGRVVRIDGQTASEVSVNFAGFKDEETKVGWGLARPGHGLSFVSTVTPELAIVASPFSHLGKHAPLIWLEEGKVTDPIDDLLSILKPTFKDDPTEGPFNHAYIIGTLHEIDFSTQGLLDDKLEIVPEDSGGHHGH